MGCRASISYLGRRALEPASRPAARLEARAAAALSLRYLLLLLATLKRLAIMLTIVLAIVLAIMLTIVLAIVLAFAAECFLDTASARGAARVVVALGAGLWLWSDQQPTQVTCAQKDTP